MKLFENEGFRAYYSSKIILEAFDPSLPQTPEMRCGRRNKVPSSSLSGQVILHVFIAMLAQKTIT